MPDYVSDVCGRMVEGRHADARIVSRRKKRITRTQACSDDPESAISLLLKPFQATTHVNNGLSSRDIADSGSSEQAWVLVMRFLRRLTIRASAWRPSTMRPHTSLT